MHDKPVLHPAGDEAGREQQDAREGGKKHRWPEQRKRLQHMPGFARVDHRRSCGELEQQRQQQHGRNHHADVAQHGSDLRAHQVRHFVNKDIQCVGALQTLELGGHGRGCHGGLFGGQRPVQQLDRDETGRINKARPKTIPKLRQAHCHHHELHPGGEGGECAAACGPAQHVAVLRTCAGDVMFARLRAALGHLGRQQRRIGRHQHAQAAPLLAHHHQVRQQPRGAGRRVAACQAIKQSTDAQHPLTQLPQAKHQVH